MAAEELLDCSQYVFPSLPAAAAAAAAVLQLDLRHLGQSLTCTPCGTEEVSSIAVHPKGGCLAAADDGGDVHLFELDPKLAAAADEAKQQQRQRQGSSLQEPQQEQGQGTGRPGGGPSLCEGALDISSHRSSMRAAEGGSSSSNGGDGLKGRASAPALKRVRSIAGAHSSLCSSVAFRGVAHPWEVLTGGLDNRAAR